MYAIRSYYELVPLDADYCEHPIEYMVPDADSGITMQRSKVWDDTIAAVRNNFV